MKTDNRIKVCHFTSAHNQLDDRIYLKECTALANAGYDVFIVARGESHNINGISIIGCGEPRGRRNRMFHFSQKIYLAALKLDCDIYHFHDPELLPYGVKLKRKGKMVIFDSHEDVPAQIIDKTWIPKMLRSVISTVYKTYETYAVKRFDATITATPYIAKQFENRARNITVINNYPQLDDIVFQKIPFVDRNRVVCYVGGISKERGEQLMIDAMKNVDGVLLIAGAHQKDELRVGGTVKYLGQLNRNEVNNVFAMSIAGLVTLLPKANYVNSQPIKMFEYMAAGLPVVCSDFLLWKQIVGENKCGICVKTDNIDEVTTAINYLLDNPEIAQEMGCNGRKAVEEKYSWKMEEKALLHLYDILLYEKRKEKV